MELAISSFALGLLLGAAKFGLIGTVGFGIAWWRTRRRLQALEAEQTRPIAEERLDRLEQGLDYIASQMDRLTQAHNDPSRALSRGEGRTSDALGQLGEARPERSVQAEPVTPH